MTDPYRQLTIQNDFIFKKVFEDPDMLKPLLKIILPEMDFSGLDIVVSEKAVNEFPYAKGIRLDVYARNGTTVLIIEMQVLPYGMHVNRAGYYQALTDVSELTKGMDYYKPGNQIIIFICPFDPLGDNMMVYTITNACEETGKRYDDGRTVIFINCTGENSEQYPELKPFADYVMGKRSDDPFVQKADRRVNEARQNPQWRHEYMTWLEKINIARKEGWDEGRTEGLAQGKAEGKISEQVRLINEQMAKGHSFEEACINLDLSPEEIEVSRQYMETGLFPVLN